MKLKKIHNLLSFAVLLFFSGTAALSAQAGAPPMIPVDNVSLVHEIGTKQYVGKLASTHSVNLKARVSGILENTYCKEGEMVKEGDLLMQIEDTLYEAQVKSAEAIVQQMQAELKYAEDNYKRQTKLTGIIAESAMDEANRLLKLQKAKLAQAEAALTEAKTNLSYTKITAPITGRIGKTSYSPGNYLTPTSDTLGSIVKISPIYVKAAISEPDYIRMFGNVDSLKKDAVIRIRTADRKMFDETGYVKIADNQVDTQTGTLMLWIVFENAKQRLIPGGIVDVFISKKVQEEYPAIRVSAIMTNKNGHYVYVLGPDNKAAVRPVVIGETIGDMQVIHEGLKPGETVIVDGTHKVMPGSVVNPIPVQKKSAEKPLPAPAGK